jgi:hypothetical protein
MTVFCLELLISIKLKKDSIHTDSSVCSDRVVAFVLLLMLVLQKLPVIYQHI